MLHRPLILSGLLSFGLALTAVHGGDRGRVKVGTLPGKSQKTVLADDGQLLRGVTCSWDWANVDFAMDNLKSHKMNLIHVWYFANGGYDASGDGDRIDNFVQGASQRGLYCCILFHSNHSPHSYTIQEHLDFWRIVGNKYKDRTHVLFELVDGYYDEGSRKEVYDSLRKWAPQTHIIIDGPLDGVDWGNASLTDGQKRDPVPQPFIYTHAYLDGGDVATAEKAGYSWNMYFYGAFTFGPYPNSADFWDSFMQEYKHVTDAGVGWMNGTTALVRTPTDAMRPARVVTPGVRMRGDRAYAPDGRALPIPARR